MEGRAQAVASHFLGNQLIIGSIVAGRSFAGGVRQKIAESEYRGAA